MPASATPVGPQLLQEQTLRTRVAIPRLQGSCYVASGSGSPMLADTVSSVAAQQVATATYGVVAPAL